ncbi:MAG: hypothetical protein V4850_24970 [Myxococcota bacterium]
MAAVVDLSGVEYAEVEILVGTDPYGIVESVVPASFTDVVPGTSLAFALDLLGVATDVALTTTISLLVYGDGELIDTIEVEVEIAPR